MLASDRGAENRKDKEDTMTAREADLVEPIVVWPDPSPLHSWWTTVMAPPTETAGARESVRRPSPDAAAEVA